MKRTAPAFMAGKLDRQSGRRNEPGFFEAMVSAPNARFALFAADRLVTGSHAGEGIGWMERGELPALHVSIEPVLLGVDAAGCPCFAVMAADAEFEPDKQRLALDLRSLALQGLLDEGDLGTAAQARALLHWHSKHRFCANCGGATIAADAGYKRVCGSCSAEHFPRTDAVAIIAVVRKDKMLLGRSARFASGMYSTLAGFVEPGETAEDAARREVFEESGVHVGEVQYVLSQPWPFPANLMLGMVGVATSEAITIDPEELDDARWFSMDEVRLMAKDNHPNGLRMPPDISIAHHLIQHVLKLQG